MLEKIAMITMPDVALIWHFRLIIESCLDRVVRDSRSFLLLGMTGFSAIGKPAVALLTRGAVGICSMGGDQRAVRLGSLFWLRGRDGVQIYA